MQSCAIIYHYLASYRLPVFSELMHSENVDYTIYSGDESETNIKKIDNELSNLAISKGGLRWVILKNKWIYKKKFLWQHGVLKVAMFGNYDSYIFLGSPYHLSTWFAVSIARLRGKKTFYWMHGFYKDTPSKVDFFKLKLFYKLPNGFFLYGNRAKSILQKHNVKPFAQMNVIYNSLDYHISLKKRCLASKEQIYDYRLKYFDDNATPVIVFIGRLNNTKRIDMLIETQNILKSRNGRNVFNLLIIGDGEEKASLFQLSKKLELEKNVNFLGAIYDEEAIAKLINFADLCVTPGEVGLTAMHSMSYGTPVISHNNLNVQMPEVEAIKLGITGDLYEYQSIESLADKIEKWFDKHPLKSNEVMNSCFSVIDNYYNPKYQRQILDSVLLK